MQVVDDEQDGLLSGDVGDEPVEPVEHPQGDVRRLAGQPGRLEERGRQLGRAGERLCSLLFGQLDEVRLEQLADDAEGERALELGAPGAERPHPRRLPAAPRLGEQSRLADSGRPLDR